MCVGACVRESCVYVCVYQYVCSYVCDVLVCVYMCECVCVWVYVHVTIHVGVCMCVYVAGLLGRKMSETPTVWLLTFGKLQVQGQVTKGVGEPRVSAVMEEGALWSGNHNSPLLKGLAGVA